MSCTLVLVVASACASPEALRADTGTGATGIFLGSIRDNDESGGTRAVGLTAIVGYCLDLEGGLPVVSGPDRFRALFSAGVPRASLATTEQIKAAQRLSGVAVLLEGEVEKSGAEARLRLTLTGNRRNVRSDWLNLSGLLVADVCRMADNFVRPATSAGNGTSPTAAQETGSDKAPLADALGFWSTAALLEGEGRTDAARNAYEQAQKRLPNFLPFSLEALRLRRFEFPGRYRRLLQKERQEINGTLRLIRSLKGRPTAMRVAARSLISAALAVAPIRPELALEFSALAEELTPTEAPRARAAALAAKLHRSPAAAAEFSLTTADGLYGIEHVEFLLAGSIALSRAPAPALGKDLDELIARISGLIGGAPSYHELMLRSLDATRRANNRDLIALNERLTMAGLAQTRLGVTAAANAAITGDAGHERLLELRVQARLLGLEDDALHATLLYNIGRAYVRAGQKHVARAYFRNAGQIYRRLGFSSESALAYGASDKRLLCPPVGLPVQVRRPHGLTPDEETVIASYTGLYDYSSHSADVQARTYGGRQADTNVFLKDLLERKETANSALYMLRTAILPASANTKGSGVLFVDIGPAVANRWEPAVTAASVARDFPEMGVVALDLPDQVERFKRVVPGSLKYRLFARQNFRILAADGVASLKAQFAQEKNWLPKERAVPALPADTLLVVRSANAVDIYLPYEAIRASLVQMAEDFPDAALLYFFNRSILYKPKGSASFRIIGFVSVRGFHHNKLSFSRDGDPAYSLSESAIKAAHKNPTEESP